MHITLDLSASQHRFLREYSFLTGVKRTAVLRRYKRAAITLIMGVTRRYEYRYPGARFPSSLQHLRPRAPGLIKGSDVVHVHYIKAPTPQYTL